MLRLLSTIAVVVLLLGCNSKKKENIGINTMSFISQQLENTLKAENNPSKIPRTTNADGSLKTVGIYNWTSGFFCRKFMVHV